MKATGIRTEQTYCAKQVRKKSTIPEQSVSHSTRGHSNPDRRIVQNTQDQEQPVVNTQEDAIPMALPAHHCPPGAHLDPELRKPQPVPIEYGSTTAPTGRRQEWRSTTPASSERCRDPEVLRGLGVKNTHGYMQQKTK